MIILRGSSFRKVGGKFNARSLERESGCSDGLVVDVVFDCDNSDSTAVRVRTFLKTEKPRMKSFCMGFINRIHNFITYPQ